MAMSSQAEIISTVTLKSRARQKSVIIGLILIVFNAFAVVGMESKLTELLWATEFVGDVFWFTFTLFGSIVFSEVLSMAVPQYEMEIYLRVHQFRFTRAK